MKNYFDGEDLFGMILVEEEKIVIYLTHFLNEYRGPLYFQYANDHFYVINYRDLLNSIISEDLLNDYFRQALILIL